MNSLGSHKSTALISPAESPPATTRSGARNFIAGQGGWDEIDARFFFGASVWDRYTHPDRTLPTKVVTDTSMARCDCSVALRKGASFLPIKEGGELDEERRTTSNSRIADTDAGGSIGGQPFMVSFWDDSRDSGLYGLDRMGFDHEPKDAMTIHEHLLRSSG